MAELVRVRDDDRRAEVSRELHRRGRAVVHADEPSRRERDGVAGEIWVRVVVRQFQSWDEDEAVRRERARPLALDLRAVVVEPLFVDARASVQRRPRVVAAQHVVGDAEDVEPRAAVEVDYLRYRKLTVTPRGV